MNEISVILQTYEQNDNRVFGWIHSGGNLADSVTKHKRCTCLERFMRPAFIPADVANWENAGGNSREALFSMVRRSCPRTVSPLSSNVSSILPPTCAPTSRSGAIKNQRPPRPRAIAHHERNTCCISRSVLLLNLVTLSVRNGLSTLPQSLHGTQARMSAAHSYNGGISRRRNGPRRHRLNAQVRRLALHHTEQTLRNEFVPRSKSPDDDSNRNPQCPTGPTRLTSLILSPSARKLTAPRTFAPS